MSKHQIRSENARWAVRRGVGRLNPRCETKIKRKNEDRNREMRDKVTKRRKFFTQTEAARQSRASPLAPKRNEESSTFA